MEAAAYCGIIKPEFRPGLATRNSGKPFLKELFDSIAADPKTEVVVNLPEQTITNKATGKSETFEINAYKKHCLMNGLDDIDFLVENKDKIEAWENKK